MRGPGPKTLARIGEVLRAELEEDTREMLPEKWLHLLEAIETAHTRG